MSTVSLKYAEIIDAHRVFPKLFMAGYGVLLGHSYLVAQASQSEFSRDIFYAVLGAAAIVTTFYFNSGRKWST